MKEISKQEAREKYGICTTGASSLCRFFLREDGCVVDEENCVRYCPSLAAMNPQVKDYFYAMGKKAQNEVPTGAWYAYRAWRNSCDQQTEPFEVAEIPWGSKVKQDAMDFVVTMREAGVTEFAVTDDSTSLMEGIHALVNAGAELAGTVMVKRQLEYNRTEVRQGIRFRIPLQ